MLTLRILQGNSQHAPAAEPARVHAAAAQAFGAAAQAAEIGIRFAAQSGGQHPGPRPVLVDQTGNPALRAEPVFQILEHDQVGLARQGAVVDPRDGLVQQIQRAVAALQVGCLGSHAGRLFGLQPDQVFRHAVEGPAELAQLVGAHVGGAGGELAPAEGGCAAQQFAQGSEQFGVQVVQGHRHGGQGEEERGAEDPAHPLGRGTGQGIGQDGGAADAEHGQQDDSAQARPQPQQQR